MATSPYTVSHLSSSSVPAASLLSSSNGGRATSTGPRLHDYAIPASNGSVTQLRPGLISVSSGDGSESSVTSHSSTLPVAVPNTTTTSHEHFTSYREGRGESWSSSRGSHYRDRPVAGLSVNSGRSGSFAPESYRSTFTSDLGGGGWSLPSSELRSVSVDDSGPKSRSRSGSGSGSRASDDESVDIDIDAEDGDINVDVGDERDGDVYAGQYRAGYANFEGYEVRGAGYGYGTKRAARNVEWDGDDFSVKEEDEDDASEAMHLGKMQSHARGEDDWEMEMDMD